MHVSAYSLKSLTMACLPLMQRRRLGRRPHLRRAVRLAEVRLDGPGQGRAGVHHPLPGPRPGQAEHPLQPGLGRSARLDGRQVHPGLRASWPTSGTTAPRSAGTSPTRSRPAAASSPCCRTGSRRPPARSSTSTAACTRSAPEPPAAPAVRAPRPPRRCAGRRRRRPCRRHPFGQRPGGRDDRARWSTRPRSRFLASSAEEVRLVRLSRSLAPVTVAVALVPSPAVRRASPPRRAWRRPAAAGPRPLGAACRTRRHTAPGRPPTATTPTPTPTGVRLHIECDRWWDLDTDGAPVEAGPRRPCG